MASSLVQCVGVNGACVKNPGRSRGVFPKRDSEFLFLIQTTLSLSVPGVRQGKPGERGRDDVNP